MQTVERTETTRTNGATPRPELPRHQAAELTGGGDVAQIELDGQIYFLRITRLGKLILTK